MFTKPELQLIADALDLLESADAEPLAARVRRTAAASDALMPGDADRPLRCPECGNENPADLLWVEDVPTLRAVRGMIGSTAVFGDDDLEREHESAHSSRLRCMATHAGAQCLTEWLTPDDVDYMDAEDFAAARTGG